MPVIQGFIGILKRYSTNNTMKCASAPTTPTNIEAAKIKLKPSRGDMTTHTGCDESHWLHYNAQDEWPLPGVLSNVTNYCYWPTAARCGHRPGPKTGRDPNEPLAGAALRWFNSPSRFPLPLLAVPSPSANDKTLHSDHQHHNRDDKQHWQAKQY